MGKAKTLRTEKEILDLISVFWWSSDCEALSRCILHRLQCSNYHWCDLRVWPLSLVIAVLMRSDICFL